MIESSPAIPIPGAAAPLVHPPALARISDYASFHAAERPGATALAVGDVRIDYGALSAKVDGLAKALLAAGVARGDRVATFAPPHPDYMIAFLATASIGAIWLGLNPKYRREELAYLLDDAGPRILLAHAAVDGEDRAADLEAVSDNGGPRLLYFGEQAYADLLDQGKVVEESRLLAARESCGGRDPCLIVYTSGSTGRPKGALLHHHGLIEASRKQNRAWPVSELRLLNYFPINHVGCVIDISCPALVGGGANIFLPSFAPGQALRLMERERITVWGSIPSVFELQLGLPDFPDYDLSSVELILWEGAAMPPSTLVRLMAICPRLATNYGMTETSSAITLVEPTDDLDILIDSVGFPLAGISLRIADEKDAAIADGMIGEIQTRSDHNMLGYWRRPEASAEAFTADGWLRTGDLGSIRPDGRLRINGRIKEMIKSGGYNVYPREVEAVLESFPAVQAAAVVGAPDPLWQEVGVAFVVLKQGAVATEEAIERHCRERLSNFKIPKRILLVDELPLLPIGKVDKRALAALAATIRSS